MQPLLPAHYEELAKFKDVASLAPDHQQYVRADLEGRLLVLLAYAGMEVIGYAVTFQSASAHYERVNLAQNDVIYVKPEYRGGLTGFRLIKTTRKRARELWGTQLLTWHTKPDTPMDALMPRMGCEKLDHLWAERL